MTKHVGRLGGGLVVALLVACGGGGYSSPTGPGTTGGNNSGGSNNTGAAPLTATVSMYQSAFTPQTVTIKVGGTVTWKNDDGIAHTATGAAFDTGTLQGTAEKTQSFATAGTYTYHCNFHSFMTGTVNVVAN